MNDLPKGLLTTEQILEHTAARSATREQYEFETGAGLNLRYEDPGQTNKGGFYATLPSVLKDGTSVLRDLPLSDTAVRTACKMIGATPDFFADADDPNAFPQWFAHKMDSTKRRARGFIVRHNGLEVNSILPAQYVIKDSNELLAEFLPSLQQNVGNIVGVLGLEQGYGDVCSYRVVMGNNIMPSLSDDKGQYLMFNINTSESGLIDTKTSLGLYRTFCTNSAIRQQTLSRWDHRTPFFQFFDKAAGTIRQAGYLQESYGKIFEELLREKLPFSALDLIGAFKQENLITNNHAEAARVHAESEPSETQYDLFNILTRSAQDLPSIAAREAAEVSAMRMFTEPGGVLEALRKAELKATRTRKGPIIPGLGGQPN